MRNNLNVSQQIVVVVFLKKSNMFNDDCFMINGVNAVGQPC